MKSTNRLKNYLENYTREKYFTDRVAQIRKDIGLPKNGIKFPGKPDYYTIEFPASVLGISYKNINYPTFPAKMTLAYSELLKPIPKLYQEMKMILFVNIYILYNERRYDVFQQFYNDTGNSVSLIEYRIDYLESKDCCDCDLKVCEEYMSAKSKKYPVTLGISPYATQNEVVDLIKNRWNYIQAHFKELERENNIEPFQKEKNQLLKVRKRQSNSKKIEDIVYLNKNLSLKKLGDIINEETGIILDFGEIGKIRSLAIKRREGK